MSVMTPTMARIAEIAFETAMRRSEILKLECKHLCLDERYLSVIDGKEGSRDVPLTLRACELLNEAVNLLGGEDRPLFDLAPYNVSQALRRGKQFLLQHKLSQMTKLRKLNTTFQTNSNTSHVV